MQAAKISEGGRVVVPVEIRKALNLKDGDTVQWELRDGEARMTTRRARLERARTLAAPYTHGWSVDDFLAARRAEVDRE